MKFQTISLNLPILAQLSRTNRLEEIMMSPLIAFPVLFNSANVRNGKTMTSGTILEYEHITGNVTSRNATSSTQHTVSPRAQFSIKPNWEKDVLFRVSGGWYHQPPSYKELKKL